jgi:hypothetical protein
VPLLWPEPSDVMGDWPAAMRELERARLAIPQLPFRKLLWGNTGNQTTAAAAVV